MSLILIIIQLITRFICPADDWSWLFFIGECL